MLRFYPHLQRFERENTSSPGPVEPSRGRRGAPLCPGPLPGWRRPLGLGAAFLSDSRAGTATRPALRSTAFLNVALGDVRAAQETGPRALESAFPGYCIRRPRCRLLPTIRRGDCCVLVPTTTPTPLSWMGSSYNREHWGPLLRHWWGRGA
ncbi:hypothetical protein NDU88_001352 [Pleurodeles waltl]|uniref:Uncharacterized protein n=1 Tax=Pleurodeles waltl TaxID=8319 RepID=A0AAV7P582_PLEWA|nr:hypothetical protein NDU88_001352 [Pleurodeles waltl]